MERWYCHNCDKVFTEADGISAPSHVWDTNHVVDYTFKEDQQTLDKFGIKV